MFKIGNIEIKNRVCVAPMAGITDKPFRMICKDYGVGLVCTEMISSKGFSSSFELPEGNIYQLRIKNARYHNRDVATNIYKKFTLAN